MVYTYLVDYVFVFVIAYMLGSIPFSWIITKWRTGKDLREIGSKNVGGRNVYRATGSWFWALLAGFLDMLRTLAAIIVPHILIVYGQNNFIGLTDGRFLLTVAGAAAILGHNWPLYFKTHGGRGITVVLGTMIYMNPILIAAWILLWPICIIIIGYSSITYIVTTILVGIIGLFIPWLMPWNPMDNLEIGILLFIIALIMLTRQGDNIRKIRSGEAKKIELIKALKGKRNLNEEMLQ